MRQFSSWRINALGAAAVLLAAAPVAAQERRNDDITVTGSTPAEAAARARAFVRATGVANGQRPAARWRDPVCPKAAGVPADKAAIVDERMRAFALQIGAPIAAAPCRANAIVNFTTDGADFARRAAKRAPRQMKDIPADRLQAIMTGAAPVRWWYITQVLGADGEPPTSVQPAFMTVEGGAAGAGLPGGEGGVQLRYKDGVVSTQKVRALAGASVVIDVGKIGDSSIETLADFAALVALAEFQPGTPPPNDSLLGLFEAEDAPLTASPSDVALLRQLYAIPLDREARAHRRMLARALAKPGAVGTPKERDD